MATLTFAAAVAGWADKVPEAIEAVWKESTKEVVRDMQTLTSEGGRMRFDTGFLQASLLASTTAMPRIIDSSAPADGGKYSFDFDQVEAVINAADLGQSLFFGYTAGYAAYREYGANGQPPDGFVRGAVQNWQPIVARNAARVKKAFGL